MISTPTADHKNNERQTISNKQQSIPLQKQKNHRIFSQLNKRKKELFKTMKKGIHPDYHEITVVLSDGSEFKTRSTMESKDNVYRSEVDSKNHPFYTDNLKLQKKAGRIDRFNKRYGNKK